MQKRHISRAEGLYLASRGLLHGFGPNGRLFHEEGLLAVCSHVCRTLYLSSLQSSVQAERGKDTCQDTSQRSSFLWCMPGSLAYTEPRRQKARDRRGSTNQDACVLGCERWSDCVCGYLGGVGVAVSSADRRWVDNRAGFALWPWTLVQAGIFKTREDIQKTYFTHAHTDTHRLNNCLCAHEFQVLF